MVRDEFVSEGFDDFNNDEISNTYNPLSNDSNTLKQRTDTSDLFLEFKLQLMGAYKIVESKTDPSTGEEIKITKIKRKKNVRVPVNKQGVEDIVGYINRLVNNHTVMGNLHNNIDFNTLMRSISMNVVQDFISKRVSWQASVEDIKWIMSNSVHLIHLFLTRTIDHGEAKSIGESFKETRHSDVKPQIKDNPLQKLAGFLGGK